MIGMGSTATATLLERELRHVAGRDRPFGIGLVHWAMSAEPELFEVAQAARPALLCVSFGDDWSWVRRAHEAGLTAATQVATVDAARRAVDSGVEVLVARGAEGGGHGEPRVGTLPLLAEVLDHIAVPVLAAGGIASARGLAAVLAAGASAAWLGTVFTTCTEAMTSQAARDALLAAGGEETVTTRVFDIAQGYPWPTTIPERVLRDEFVDRWDGREDELAANPGDYQVAPVNAGQGVGMVTDTRSAAETIERLCGGAAALLRRWS